METQKRKRQNNFSDAEDRVLMESYCSQYEQMNGNFSKNPNGAQLRRECWEILAKRYLKFVVHYRRHHNAMNKPF